MKKIKVVRLSGCSWCEALVSQLDNFKLTYESIDADINSDLADKLEDILNTNMYPIVIIDSPITSFYLFRPKDTKGVGLTIISKSITKIGCLTAEEMVTQIKNLIYE